MNNLASDLRAKNSVCLYYPFYFSQEDWLLPHMKHCSGERYKMVGQSRSQTMLISRAEGYAKSSGLTASFHLSQLGFKVGQAMLSTVGPNKSNRLNGPTIDQIEPWALSV